MALILCKNCGQEISDLAQTCPRCGQVQETQTASVEQAVAAPAQCPECGGQLPVDAAVCPACGCPVEKGEEAAPVQQSPEGKKKKKGLLAAVAAAVVIVAAVLMTRGSGPNFKKIYEQYCDPIWASVGADNSYLSVDTNPYDEDDNGAAYMDAYWAIKNINAELGLPDSLFNDMGHTTGNDGRQSEPIGEIYVSWRYHPDKGLEVTWKKNK